MILSSLRTLSRKPVLFFSLSLFLLSFVPRADALTLAEKDLSLVLSRDPDVAIRFEEGSTPLFPRDWYAQIIASFAGTPVGDAIQQENSSRDWQLVAMRVAPCIKNLFKSASKNGLNGVEDIKNLAHVAGDAKIENFESFLTSAARNRDGLVLIFKADKAVEHFAKHGNEVMTVLGKTSYNLKEYMEDAHHLIKSGQFVPEMNGYVKLIGGHGTAKAGFVGLTQDSKNITTFHIKTVAELKKKAPSLGWE